MNKKYLLLYLLIIFVVSIIGIGLYFACIDIKSNKEKSMGNVEEKTYIKDFGSYAILNGWEESKSHSSKNKFFYIAQGTEDIEKPNNISIHVGNNQYSISEHEKFKEVILTQLSIQISASTDTNLNASGSHTENGYILYTFVIHEETEDITTTQYYIVGDYQYALIHETVFDNAEETDRVAKRMVNTFKWKSD